ncbi:MAG: hypothetical protein WA996_04365 [Candidatus Promineifilaceae bacterium]
MNQKRIPLRVVFLSISMVFIATVLILQYLLSGQPIFSMPSGEEIQPSLAVIETKTSVAGSDGFFNGSSESDSSIPFEENLHSTAPAQSGQSPTVPETIEFQVIQLVIPELNIDASVGSVGLLPGGVGGSQSNDPGTSLGSSHGQYLQIDPAGETDNLNIDGQNYVDIDAIRDMLGLEADAQFTVYKLSNDYLINAAQIESYSGEQQPIVIMLDNARWILPERGGSMQIATSWPGGMGQSRFVIVAKPLGATADAEILN